jgi:hypothetical protein
MAWRSGTGFEDRQVKGRGTGKEEEEDILSLSPLLSLHYLSVLRRMLSHLQEMTLGHVQGRIQLGEGLRRKRSPLYFRE